MSMSLCSRAAAAAMIATITTGALAGNTEVWNFDATTEGQDVFWTSPTAVDNTAPRYDTTYEITLLEVTVSFSIFEFGPFDVTDQIPEEFRIGGGILDGPPPIELFNGDLVFPPPPDPVTFAGTIDLSIDGDGFGQFSLTDVTLGTMDYDLGPPFGVVTVQLESVHTAGVVTVTPLGPAEDITGDGVVDILDLLAVLAAWGEFGGPADVNGDGVVDILDLLAVLAAWT